MLPPPLPAAGGVVVVVQSSQVAPPPPDDSATGYERRRPEQTLLHQTVAQHWQALKEQADARGGQPKFVVREAEDYLDCDILS